MNLAKNSEISLSITGMTGEGLGVGRYEGLAVMVPGVVMGETVAVKITKLQKTYAYARLMAVITPSPERVEPDCAVYPACGGCCFRHMSYEAELFVKERQVQDAFRRIGGYEGAFSPILPSPHTDGYRNKAQLPVRMGEHGPTAGYFAPRSHRLVPHPRCPLSPAVFDEIREHCLELVERYDIPPYDEERHTGLLRHIYLRQGEGSGDILVCFVVNAARLPHESEIAAALMARFPGIVGVLVSENRARDNVILGPGCRVVAGEGTLRDQICGIPVRLSPLSFYQVNRAAAEGVYRLAAEAAALTGAETLLDLYCGIGLIGLSMAGKAKRLVGVEIVPQAVEDARENMRAAGVVNAEFRCMDAAKAAAMLRAEGLPVDVVLLDPPRKGCDEALLQTVAEMGPERVVMISCNPATAARDCKRLTELGYEIHSVHPADMFPRTGNVEAVALLRRRQTPR